MDAFKKSLLALFGLALLASLAGALSFVIGQTVKEQEEAAKRHHTVVPLAPLTAESLKKLSVRGFEVVSGDPDKPGAPFVIRIYNFENQVVLPHWHPEGEHLTVIKGTWSIGEGDTFDRTALREMNVGDYLFVPKQMRHYGWAKNVVIVQIHGIGPFKVNVADPWMSLSDANAASHFKFKLNDRVRSERGEGLVVFGYYSEKNKIKQYLVAKNEVEGFAEFEEKLEKVR